MNCLTDTEDLLLQTEEAMAEWRKDGDTADSGYLALELISTALRFALSMPQADGSLEALRKAIDAAYQARR